MCSKVLQLKETAHSCNANAELLLKIFNIDTKTDSTNVHPRTYCHKCHTTAKKMASGEDGTVIETAIVPFEWSLHIDDCCWVCKGKAGRQKKGTKKRGRPKEESGKGIANRVLRTAPPSWRAAQPLSLSRFLPPATSLSLHDLQCKLCECIVDRPVETPCRSLVCAQCIGNHVLTVDSSFSCPCSKESHELSPSMFVAASDVVLKV